MKIQIVEYKLHTPTSLSVINRYTLELDNRVLLQFDFENISLPVDYVTKKLMSHLRLLTDYDLENYKRFHIDNLTGISKKILLEQEVSDSFLKELYVEKKMKAIEGDFL